MEHQGFDFKSEDLDYNSDLAIYSGIDLTYPVFENCESLMILNAIPPSQIVGLQDRCVEIATVGEGRLLLQRSPGQPVPERKRLHFLQWTTWWRLLTSPAS